MAREVKKKTKKKKKDDKVAYTPISEKEKEKKIKQLIKDLQSGKKTVPVSYPNETWKI